MELDVKNILAHNVKKLREFKGLSQAEFAEIISLQIQAISLIENAKTYPLPETVSNICKKFNVSPWVLFSTCEYFSKENYNSRQELLDSINISLTQMDETKLKFILDFLCLVEKQDLK